MDKGNDQRAFYVHQNSQCYIILYSCDFFGFVKNFFTLNALTSSFKRHNFHAYFYVMRKNLRQNIQSLLSVLVVIGLCASLFHVHGEDVSNASVESPTSHEISHEHDSCFLCAYNTESIESDQFAQLYEIALIEVLEMQKLVNAPSNPLTFTSDRAPPFFA